jgi:hypothetical protein
MSERKHADLWRELVDEAGEDEIERAASMSREQVEAELKAAGVDVEAERAEANAFLDDLARGKIELGASASDKHQSAPAAVSPKAVARKAAAPKGVEPKAPRPARRPAFAWLAAAASIGAIVGGGLVPPIEQALVTTFPPDPAAAELRRQATAACDAKQWAVCLADLDKARALDPGGDGTQAVKSLRDKAIAEILK